MNNILNDIDNYVTSKKMLIREEYSKIIANRVKIKINRDYFYEIEVAGIYQKFLEYEQFILKNSIMIENTDIIDDKINLFNNIFETYYKMKELVKRFELKKNKTIIL